MKKPRIAIPEIDQNVGNYVNAALAAGMDPTVVSVQTHQVDSRYLQEYLDYAEFQPDTYDGLLLPGGWDIHPSRYGQQNRGCMMICTEVDDLQFAMLEDFLVRRKPVLGICRGHQLINVRFGGTLIQDLPTSDRHFHADNEPDRVHLCDTAEGSWINRLYGTTYSGNSSHHQAVDRVGEGIKIDSRCLDDGVVEALHHETLPVYGVQWHPERTCLAFSREDAVNGLKIFDFFCEVCGGDPQAYRRSQAEEVMTNMMGL